MSRKAGPAPAFVWLIGVRRWLHGDVGPDGEQLVLPGMPEPPESIVPRAVAFVVFSYADPDGGNVRPGHTAIARVLNVHKRSVERAVRDLVALGLLTVESSTTAPGRARRYRLQSPPWLSNGTPTGDTGVARSSETGDTGVARSVANGRHREHQRATQGTPTGDTGVALPGGDQDKTRGDARAATSDTADNPDDPRPPDCQKHRNGNPDDQPCRRCRDVRLWTERHQASTQATRVPDPWCGRCHHAHPPGPCPQLCEHGVPPNRCAVCRTRGEAAS